jgi:tripartite-type tricarboxylate transporter receptor subunit TctC
MNAAMAEALNEPMVKQNLSEQGVDYRLSSPEEFGGFIESEVKRWAKVVKDNNIVVKD